MSKKANQHYVPQFYFRYFSENGKSICVLNRDTGKAIESASIKGQASKKHFYGDSNIEDRLSEIEGLFSTALREIRKSFNFKTCSSESYVLLLQNIMLQKSRTMSARKKSKVIQDKLLQLYMECEVNNDESLDEETKEAFRNVAKKLEADPKQYQSMEMSIAVECAEGLVDLLPIILHTKTFRPFIFGDAPVIFVNPLQKQIKLRGVLGAKTPGLIVLYPLGPKHCLMLIDERAYKIKKLRNSILPVRNKTDIAAINKLQLHNATSAVYFSNFKYSQYVCGLWKQEKAKLVDHKGKVVEAPGFYHTGEPMGDILHSFEEQLPFMPRLSFIEYQEVREEEYRFSRRGEYA